MSPSRAAPGENDPGELSPPETHAARGIYEVRQTSARRLTCAWRLRRGTRSHGANIEE